MPTASTKSDPLLTCSEVAAHYGVSPTTIRRWAMDGRIPCVRVTRKTVRYRIRDIEAALAANEIKTA